jgi:hypothetical protein
MFSIKISLILITLQNYSKILFNNKKYLNSNVLVIKFRKLQIKFFMIKKNISLKYKMI